MRTYTAYRLMDSAGAQAHATPYSVTRMCFKADRRPGAIMGLNLPIAPSRLDSRRATLPSYHYRKGGSATDLTSLRITVLRVVTQPVTYVLAPTQAFSR